MIKAIIVDDEERARSLLQKLLMDYCRNVEVIASCPNVPDAVIQINRLNPDVVFLDIEMPDYSGFELLSFFSEVNFEIIFVTAYNEYAVKAFEVSALDYILKPVQLEKLDAALERLRKKLEIGSIQNRLETLKSNLKDHRISRIALPVFDGLIFVSLSDIIYLEAMGAYTKFHIQGMDCQVISKKIKYFETMLAPNPQFFRVHRSYMVNTFMIKKYSRQENSMLMENNDTVYISRERKKEFEKAVSQYK